MLQNNTVFLILGKSGSGKTTLVNYLKTQYHLRVLKSYTTRKPRSPKDIDHIFVSKEDYDTAKDIIAETFFDNNYYFATKEQYNNCDLYVIDAKGIDSLKTQVGLKPFKTIYIDCPDDILQERIIKRDGNLNRYYHDIEHYIIPPVDFIVEYNNNFDYMVKQVIDYIFKER